MDAMAIVAGLVFVLTFRAKGRLQFRLPLQARVSGA